MFKTKTYTVHCDSIADEVQQTYSELREELGLSKVRINKQTLESLMSFLMYDALNLKTAKQFKKSDSLTAVFLMDYFANNIRVTSTVKHCIETRFTKYLLKEFAGLVRKIHENYDDKYSEWHVSVSAEGLPLLDVQYLGDYRIQEWNEAQKQKRKVKPELPEILNGINISGIPNSQVNALIELSAL